MIALLAVHAVVGLVVFASGTRWQHRAFLVAAVPQLATFVWLMVQMPGVVDGDVVRSSVEWVPTLDIAIELRLDGFAALMVTLVSGIGFLVCVYAASYFRPHGDHPAAEGLGRLAGLVVLFSGAMLAVVLADDLLLLFTAWELTSITSYLLIGNDHTRPAARAAALHALLVTSAGGLAMLAGFVLVGQAAGTYRLSEIIAAATLGYHGDRRADAGAAGRVHEVGAVPVPLVAARCDGGADTDQRVPPLGHDGEGRRVPGGAARTGLRPRRPVGGRS